MHKIILGEPRRGRPGAQAWSLHTCDLDTDWDEPTMRRKPTAVLLRLLLLALSLPAATAAAGSWEITGPAQVLASCRPGPNGPCFTDDRGAQWDLVLDPADRAIPNRTARGFYPARVDWVREAVAAIDPRVRARLDAHIVVLPLPRRALLRSSCDGRTIYISPGVRPLPREAVHFLVFHEVGHLIHRQLLPDFDGAGWNRYRELRGIDDLLRFHERAPHGNRPHEIFAEDFRRLFGSDAARAVEPHHRSAAPELSLREHLVRSFFGALLDSGSATAHRALP